jgi:transposase
MSYPHILGADISKDTIDLALYSPKAHLKIENAPAGFSLLVKWLRELRIPCEQVLLVMEHTGRYSYHLEAFLHHKSIRFTKVPALQIQRSLGMLRGKTDKADAGRIACYGYEKAASLVPASPKPVILERLQVLSTTRALLVSQRAAQKNALRSLKETLSLKDSDSSVKALESAIKHFGSTIEKLEAQMDQLIQSDEKVAVNYRLLLSIKGVGPVLARAVIVKTENFTRFDNARKFACYCGVAPFEHSSGSSIRGKTRVSHLADKSMKTLLDLAAQTAVQHDEELKQYYQARLGKGKSKRSTINVVRNKILYRIFAIIKRQEPFLQEYKRAA